jgi:hypothetical protein
MGLRDNGRKKTQFGLGCAGIAADFIFVLKMIGLHVVVSIY